MNRPVTTLFLVPVMCLAQGGSPASTRSLPTTIQTAENEGAAFMREAAPRSLPSGFNEEQGTGDRKCVEFPIMLDAPVARRSGEFLVGGQTGGLSSGSEGKVWWFPMHDPATRKATLEVRSIRLDDSSKTSVFKSQNYAWPISSGVPDLEHGFYPSGFALPSAGRWLLVATSASDWGCFIVTVQP
jgi:hypothetical protein